MPLLLMLGFIALEAWIVTQAVHRFGGGWVLAALLATAVGGVLLIQRQGLRTIREVQMSTARGELPTVALLEGMVALMAGLLLIVPGFVSDLIGLSLLLVGLRKRLATRIGDGMAKARPDLKQPVTLEGEYQRRK